MTDYLPIGRKVLIDKRDWQPRFMHISMGIINPLHLTRQNFLEQFKNNVFPPSIPAKNKQCDVDLIGTKSKQNTIIIFILQIRDDPNQIFQEFNLKDILPQHIARPYIYIKKINKRITPKERGTLTKQELEKYNYTHVGDWNKSTHLKSFKVVKNSNKNKIDLLRSTEGFNKQEREEFYEMTQLQTQYIFEFYKMIKQLLRRKNKSIHSFKSEVQEYIKNKKKQVDSDQIFFTKQEIQDFLDNLNQSQDNSKIKSVLNNFFSCVYDEQLCLNKISMRALVYNVNRYYESKQKIEQKFSVAKAKKLNAQIHYDACYWISNYKTLVQNLKQLEDKEKSAKEKILNLYGEKMHNQFKMLIDDRNKHMKIRVALAKFFKNSLQVKQLLEIDIIAKAFIQKILAKSQEIALFQDFIQSYFDENEQRKAQEIIKKEDIAQYLIKCQYLKEDANIIIKKVISLYKYSQEEKQENSNIIIKEVDKETFLEFLKLNLKKQDEKMSIFIKMMNGIQKYFENEVEIHDIKEKSAKKYEMNMIANYILSYLQKIDRKFLKCQWKILSILKLFEENTISLQKLEGIFNSHGVPSSFTLKFLFSSQVYQKKSNFLCQERQLAQWKIDLQKALGIYKQEIEKMKNFFEELGDENNFYENEEEEDFYDNQENQLQNNNNIKYDEQVNTTDLNKDKQIKENIESNRHIESQPKRASSLKKIEDVQEQVKSNIESKKRISFAQIPSENTQINRQPVRQKSNLLSVKNSQQSFLYIKGLKSDKYDQLSSASTDTDYLTMCESLISKIKVENYLI